MKLDFTETMQEVSDFFVDFLKNEQVYNEDDFEEKIFAIARALSMLSASYVHQGVFKNIITRRNAYGYINKIGEKYVKDSKSYFMDIEFSLGIEEFRKNRKEPSSLLPNLNEEN